MPTPSAPAGPSPGAAYPSGLLLVDKSGGLTSHDVVAQARRLLHTRAVGHAGTLDPMATGLMVLLIGEATKLSPYLSADRKRYEAEVCLGVTTDSLDADGVRGHEHPIDDALRAELALGVESIRLVQALELERSRREQIPPAVSALHVDGERAHERVRRGEILDLPPRLVQVHKLTLQGLDAASPLPRLRFELDVAKGYYVRAFARDLGASLGLPAHLTRLRRLASGPFELTNAAPLTPNAPLPPWLSLTEAARRALPIATLTADGVLRARQGKRLQAEHFVDPPLAAVAAWLDEAEQLVAVGAPDQDETEGPGWRVRRGFV